MAKLILLLNIAISTTIVIANVDLNEKWTGLHHSNLVSYSYGPPSKAQTLIQEKDITLTVLTDNIKLQCTTRRTNLPIVWRKQSCENKRWSRATILAEGTYNYFPEKYDLDLEVEGSADEVTSILTIQNVSIKSSQGIFTCQTTIQQQESFLMGNEESLKTCLSRRLNHDTRESKTSTANTEYDIDNGISKVQQWYSIDDNTISKTQWDNTGINHISRDSKHHKGKDYPTTSNRFDNYHESSSRIPSTRFSYLGSRYSDFESTMDKADSYFPIQDPYSSGPYPNSVNFKPSVEYPNEENVKPTGVNEMNITQEVANNTSTIMKPSNMTDDMENGNDMFQNTLNNNTSELFNPINVTEIITNKNDTGVNNATNQMNSSTISPTEISMNSAIKPLSSLDSTVNQSETRLKPQNQRFNIR